MQLGPEGLRRLEEQSRGVETPNCRRVCASVGGSRGGEVQEILVRVGLAHLLLDLHARPIFLVLLLQTRQVLVRDDFPLLLFRVQLVLELVDRLADFLRGLWGFRRGAGAALLENRGDGFAV